MFARSDVQCSRGVQQLRKGFGFPFTRSLSTFQPRSLISHGVILEVFLIIIIIIHHVINKPSSN